MSDTIEVDARYLWALEVLEAAGPSASVSRSTYRKARRIVEEHDRQAYTVSRPT